MGHGEPAVGVSWSFNGQTLVNASYVTIYDEDVVEGGITYRQSILQLCFLRNSNSGAYTCTVSNGFLQVNATTQVNVTGEFKFQSVVSH